MEGIRSLMLPQSVLAQKMQKSEKTILATSSGKQTYDVSYYVKGALAGGICCGITHGSLW